MFVEVQSRGVQLQPSSQAWLGYLGLQNRCLAEVQRLACGLRLGDHLLPNSAGLGFSPGDSDQTGSCHPLEKVRPTDGNLTHQTFPEEPREASPARTLGGDQPGRAWSMSARFQHGSF